MFVVAAIAALLPGRSWAIYDKLGPSADEWKMKYDVEMKPVEGDKQTVVFTLADEGRLKPFYSIEVVAFSRQIDSQGGRSYDLKAPIELKATDDGKRAGEVQIRKDLADRAIIRILTLTVDGKRRSSAAYYDIPLKKFLNKAQAASSTKLPPSVAAPSAARVSR